MAREITSVQALTSAIEALANVGYDAAVVEKLSKIRASYEKKAEAAKGKSSTKGAENAEMGEKILDEMEDGKGYTLSDMMHFQCLADMELTTAKVRALIDAPLDQGRLVKSVVKGRVVYSRA